MSYQELPCIPHPALTEPEASTHQETD